MKLKVFNIDENGRTKFGQFLNNHKIPLNFENPSINRKKRVYSPNFKKIEDIKYNNSVKVLLRDEYCIHKESEKSNIKLNYIRKVNQEKRELCVEMKILIRYFRP